MNLMENNFIKGQRALSRLLCEVKDGRVSHAYILEGPRGVGKKTAARIFAAALHCQGADKPCGSCHSCAMHRAGTHPDVLMLESEDNGNIKIDSVRAAAEELYMRPKVSDKKVLIIDGADGMNEAAQNALLKTFEEPPAYGVVVLLSENIQNLLPTIRSRGVKLLLEPFPEEKIKSFVERAYPAMRDKSGFAARYSGGIVGKAIDICEDEDFFALRGEMFGALSGLTGGKECIFPIAEVFGMGKKSDSYRKSVCFDLMLSWLGDVAAIKNGGETVNSDYNEQIRAFASKVTARGAVSAVETAAETLRGLNPSMKYDLWIVNMLIKCWRDIHGYSSWS